MENFKIWDLKKNHMLAYKIDLESLEMSSNWNGDYMSWDQWRWQHFLGNVEVLSKFLNKLRLNTNLRKQRKTIPKIRKNRTKQVGFIWFGSKIWILHPRIKITSKNPLRLNHFTPSRIFQALSTVQWRRLTLWNPLTLKSSHFCSVIQKTHTSFFIFHTFIQVHGKG